MTRGPYRKTTAKINREAIEANIQNAGIHYPEFLYVKADTAAAARKFFGLSKKWPCYEMTTCSWRLVSPAWMKQNGLELPCEAVAELKLKGLLQ
jgi:hypothetical protein